MLIKESDTARAQEVLKKNGIQVTITQGDESSQDTFAKKPHIRPGKRKKGDLPSAFGNIWGQDERTLDNIQQKAWPERK